MLFRSSADPPAGTDATSTEVENALSLVFDSGVSDPKTRMFAVSDPVFDTVHLNVTPSPGFKVKTLSVTVTSGEQDFKVNDGSLAKTTGIVTKTNTPPIKSFEKVFITILSFFIFNLVLLQYTRKRRRKKISVNPFQINDFAPEEEFFLSHL